jgi:hypothetical protein
VEAFSVDDGDVLARPALPWLVGWGAGDAAGAYRLAAKAWAKSMPPAAAAPLAESDVFEDALLLLPLEADAPEA